MPAINSLGAIIALVVLVLAILFLFVPVPSQAVLLLIAGLAVARLT